MNLSVSVCPAFDKGVAHRNISQAAWREKPLRLQLAIVLAANKNRVDAWELVRPECQAAHLAEADGVIEGGGGGGGGRG
jgi:hypothetical protein